MYEICVCCHHKKFKLLFSNLFRPVSPRSKASQGGLGCWGGLASFLKWIYQDFRWTENTKSQIHHRIIMIVKFKECWETLEGKSTCRHHRRKKRILFWPTVMQRQGGADSCRPPWLCVTVLYPSDDFLWGDLSPSFYDISIFFGENLAVQRCFSCPHYCKVLEFFYYKEIKIGCSRFKMKTRGF